MLIWNCTNRLDFSDEPADILGEERGHDDEDGGIEAADVQDDPLS